MNTINATGDTTLHTAGKYCPEDILVKVPAGGSGGLETSEFTFSGNTSSHYPIYISYTTVDINGKLTVVEQDVSTSSVTVTCTRNSIVFVQTKSSYNATGYAYNCELLRTIGNTGMVIKINSPVANPNASYNNTYGSSGGGTND